MRTNFLTRAVRRSLVGVALLVAAAAVGAQPLTVTVLQPDQIGPAGATYSFEGMVRNDTGHALLTTDLFFNFAGFDPAFLTPHQVLGNVGSSIANGATSPSLGLFTLDLAAAATPGSRFSADVLLQDDAGSLSEPLAVSVTVVPEPATVALLAVGLVPLLGRLYRRRIDVRPG